MEHFDVLVVGGGHAGCEAAHAAARVGVKTAVVTMTENDFGVMSCNPAIGGLGKGHLVREIDALDGLMARAADAAAIQFRLLNRRKGPAVQGPRAQADRRAYQAWMTREMTSTDQLECVYGEVASLLMESNKVTGVKLSDGREIGASTVVLTTGTFLDGAILIGDVRKSGGRVGSKASMALAQQFREFELPTGRLKTGTPPRLAYDSIGWDMLEPQHGDEDPVMFSFLNKSPEIEQIPCFITHTNAKTHDIIRENLEKSAMYGGHVEGVGPRYCPSIEDKIVRFSDKDSHQVFLEPEGLDRTTVYPNGVSTSLPADVQEEYIQSIFGLENARILQPGYAIEYDYVDPRALNADLSVRSMNGFFLAGQINGTTGYEEAGAQGLVAGLNAARMSQDLQTHVFSRTDSYIGVMIDDLVTKGVTEPYRMFTSRAEYRLSLRADNADQRLTPIGIELGLVQEFRAAAFDGKLNALTDAKSVLSSKSFTSSSLKQFGVALANDGTRRTGLELLGLSSVENDVVKSIDPAFSSIDEDVFEQLAKESLYSNYLDRQEREIEIVRKDEALAIPVDFDFSLVSGLSSELQGKLMRSQPSSIGQAGRIEGMTPAGLILVIGAVRRLDRKASGA